MNPFGIWVQVGLSFEVQGAVFRFKRTKIGSILVVMSCYIHVLCCLGHPYLLKSFHCLPDSVYLGISKRVGKRRIPIQRSSYYFDCILRLSGLFAVMFYAYGVYLHSGSSLCKLCTGQGQDDKDDKQGEKLSFVNER
jgi:hypothetical protein